MKLFQYLEANAACYEQSQRLISLNYRAYRRMLAGAGFFPPSGSVLDLGCGTGFLSEWLPPNTRYRGIDFNPSYVAYARARRGPRFTVDDATLLETVEESFDTVIAIGLLHHLDNAGVLAVLARASAHLRPDGLLYVIEAIPPRPENRVGQWLRNHDNGAWIRPKAAWEGLLAESFDLLHVAPCHQWPLDYLCLKGRLR